MPVCHLQPGALVKLPVSFGVALSQLGVNGFVFGGGQRIVAKSDGAIRHEPLVSEHAVSVRNQPAESPVAVKHSCTGLLKFVTRASLGALVQLLTGALCLQVQQKVPTFRMENASDHANPVVAANPKLDSCK